jgi:nitronate monooxygenase
MFSTRLCALLGIDVPIINAPMGGGYARAELAAAVSEAGGLGMIGGTTGGGADWLRRQIHRARELTGHPFGVGFISHLPGAGALMEVALEERVPVIAHSFADPAPFVAGAHAAGALVLCQVRTVAEARQAAAAGVDVVVAQGTEAGGHTGMVSTLPLVPAVVDAVAPLPVVAAGGNADGRGIAAALMLGAEGVWIGTRFVATPEANFPEAKKQRVLAAGADDTILTPVHDIADRMPWPEGVRGRSVRNAFSDRWHGREAELAAWIEANGERHLANQRVHDPDETSIYAGEAAGLIHSIETAGDLVRRLIAEAEAVMRGRTATVLGASD